jgi:uncharacterized protein VirK/YbjX
MTIGNLSNMELVYARAGEGKKERIYRSFIHQIVEFLQYEYRTKGLLRSLRVFVTSARGTAHLRKHIALFSLPLIRRYIAIPNDLDQMFHVRHRHYLCKGFNLRERIDSALSHYRFENDNYSKSYKKLVYRDGGLVLWSAMVDGTLYEIRLRGPIKDRHEGGTSIVMLVDRTAPLTGFSYAWINAALIKAGDGIVPFITKNQSVRHDTAAMQMFRTHFPQHSPHYFCLAAMQGVAIANGMKKIAAVKHDSQIAFSEKYEKSFRRSYSDLWQAFGACALGEKAYLMHLPLALRPLDQVSSKHRKRAAMRRWQWEIITKSAAASLAPQIRLRR